MPLVRLRICRQILRRQYTHPFIEAFLRDVTGGALSGGRVNQTIDVPRNPEVSVSRAGRAPLAQG
jgi:hypothetical protein